MQLILKPKISRNENRKSHGMKTENITEQKSEIPRNGKKLFRFYRYYLFLILPAVIWYLAKF